MRNYTLIALITLTGCQYGVSEVSIVAVDDGSVETPTEDPDPVQDVEDDVPAEPCFNQQISSSPFYGITSERMLEHDSESGVLLSLDVHNLTYDSQSHSTYTYNEDGFLLVSETHDDAGELTDSESITRDSENRILIYDHYDGEGQWANDELYEMRYDALGRIIYEMVDNGRDGSDFTYEWTYSGTTLAGTWVVTHYDNDDNATYIYEALNDDDGREIWSRSQQLDNVRATVTDYMYTFESDGSYSVLGSGCYEVYGTTGSCWRKRFDYNAYDRQIGYARDFDNDGIWEVDEVTYGYVYDVSGNVLERHNFDQGYYTEISYDEDGNRITEDRYLVDGTHIYDLDISRDDFGRMTRSAQDFDSWSEAVDGVAESVIDYSYGCPAFPDRDDPDFTRPTHFTTLSEDD